MAQRSDRIQSKPSPTARHQERGLRAPRPEEKTHGAATRHMQGIAKAKGHGTLEISATVGWPRGIDTVANRIEATPWLL